MYFHSGATSAQIYDKQHLLPFGEHIPLADRFTFLKEAVEGMTHHEKGSQDVTWNSQNVRMAVGICYEAIFPEITRRQMNHDNADLLLNLTNDVWFGNTAAPYLHLMVQQARAIEMRSWLVRSTNSGISAYIDPTGRIRASSRLNSIDTLIAELAIPDVGLSIYRRFGDLWLYLSVTFACLYLAFKQFRRQKKIRSARNLSNTPVSQHMQEKPPAEDGPK